jgi:protein SCO1
MIKHYSIITIVLLLLMSACSSNNEETERNLVTFPLRGVVVAVEIEQRSVTIDHEEIKEYMKAMTMPFKVKDSTLLLGLQSGDTVEATLAVSRTGSWLETLSVVGRGEPVRTLTPEEIGMRKLFREGEVLPDIPLVNQENRSVKFSDFRGKVVALTMVYTRCPIPDYCIRMSDYFSKIQKRLQGDKRLDGQWRLLTISFDPEFDTPAVMKRYGQSYHADFATWSFLTGSSDAIYKLADGLEMTIADDEGGLIAHNLRTAFISPSGALVRIIKGNEWTPDEVVQQIRELVN